MCQVGLAVELPLLGRHCQLSPQQRGRVGRRASFPTRLETLDELENSSYVLVMTPGAHGVRTRAGCQSGSVQTWNRYGQGSRQRNASAQRVSVAVRQRSSGKMYGPNIQRTTRPSPGAKRGCPRAVARLTEHIYSIPGPGFQSHFLGHRYVLAGTMATTRWPSVGLPEFREPVRGIVMAVNLDG